MYTPSPTLFNLLSITLSLLFPFLIHKLKLVFSHLITHVPFLYTCSFVKALTLLDKDFRQAMRSANNAHEKPVITEENLKVILGNVGSLLTLNSGLLQELEERMAQW